MSGFLAVVYYFLIVIHVLVCVIMMLTILLQAGKSAGLGAGFGGSSQTLFGAGGGTAFLAKFTATCAVIFAFTSFAIAKISSPSERSLEKKAKALAEKVKKGKGQEVKLEDINPTNVVVDASTVEVIVVPPTGGSAEGGAATPAPAAEGAEAAPVPPEATTLPAPAPAPGEAAGGSTEPAKEPAAAPGAAEPAPAPPAEPAPAPATPPAGGTTP